jgi:hypothetical protein
VPVLVAVLVLVVVSVLPAQTMPVGQTMVMSGVSNAQSLFVDEHTCANPL